MVVAGVGAGLDDDDDVNSIRTIVLHELEMLRRIRWRGRSSSSDTRHQKEKESKSRTR